MMLQSLREVSVACGWMESGGFAEKQVHFLLMIERDGQPHRRNGVLDCWFPLTTTKMKGSALGRAYSDRPETLRRNQNFVDADCFVGRADRLVLASGQDSPSGKCCAETHKLAMEQSERIPELKPIMAFYELLKSGHLREELREALAAALEPYQPKARPGKAPKLKVPEKQEIAFCLADGDYRPIFELPAVRKLWRERLGAPAPDSGGSALACLCCGHTCEPVRIHERVVKGLPGKGSKGVALMSYNKESSQSHGLEDCLNAPMCSACVDAYTIGLNKLLKNSPPKGGGPAYGGSERLAGMAMIYWFRDPVPMRPVDRIINGVQHVETRLESVQVGSRPSLVGRLNRFFMAVMSAPTLGRAVVHDWIEESLDQVDSSLERWFTDTQIINRFGGCLSGGLRFAEPGKGVKGAAWAEIMDRHIPSALAREIKDRDKIRDRGMRWDLQKDDVLAIFERALLGRKLPLSIMHLALERLHEGIHDAKEKKRSALPGFSTARLGLMRAVLNDHPELLWERKAIMPGLDRDRGDPAYVCGRLLAILSRIQAKAMAGRDSDDEKERRLSANVVSRYYGAASSRPATGLYLPLRMRVHHLAKLDRDDADEAKYRRIDLQDAMKWVDPDNLPKILSPAQQCVFAIGFEHQMAEFYRRRPKPEERGDNGIATVDNQLNEGSK